MGVSETGASHFLKKGKKLKKFLTSCFLLLVFLVSIPAFAEDGVSGSAEDKAREVHKLASSDMIYSQEEVKALYYQNIEIINLLKEIRDLLQARNEQQK